MWVFNHLFICPPPSPPMHPPYLSICWPFPAVPVLRVSLYLPWRPADGYCGGSEYSSYQYGLHQCWISHSGLADCPPAAYSNIVSRIVIFEAEPRLSSLRAARYSQRKKGRNRLRQKTLRFYFLQMSILSRRREPLRAPPSDCSSWTQKKWSAGKTMQRKTGLRPKIGLEKCLDL